ncbi:MAG: hypothetical protein KF784_06720 [Fimbriimonadaceae bacterium]|nr:hypothetical protein [Fimbriimonadaceae bacterium]
MNEQTAACRRFALLLSGIAAALSLLPFLYGLVQQPAGTEYLGFQFNTDDHMVYSAWMHQAMDGHFLMDNRFAVDDQPGLTVHLLFFVLGLFAKIVGIPWACAIAKALFSGLAVWLLYGLVSRISENGYFIKLTLFITVFGAGVGYAIWHNFGSAIVRPEGSPLAGFLLSKLPSDVWQPEGFVFPSMLTNALFMASLCLILAVLHAVLASSESWKPAIWGSVCFGLLMNIHSYDVLLVFFVLITFALMLLAQKQLTGIWALRVFVIGLGAIPAALWFMHVLQNDAVFQARAATGTYTQNFRQILLGYLPLVALSLVAFFKGDGEEESPGMKRKAGFTLIVVGLVILIVASGSHLKDEYWMGWPAFAITLIGAIAACVLLSGKNRVWNLMTAWAVVGLVAPYFPALFQRKLTMGLSVPWGILAGYGLYILLKDRDKGIRNMLGSLGIVAVCASSVLWLQREMLYIRNDVSRTTLQPVYLTPDAQRIIKLLDEDKASRKIVLAMPGIYLSGEKPDSFGIVYLPDLNPVLSGFAGAYSYAGHWSETPDYGLRRSEATAFFLSQTPENLRTEILNNSRANYIVAPVPDAFPDFNRLTNANLASVKEFGEVVYEGSQLCLIRVRK